MRWPSVWHGILITALAFWVGVMLYFSAMLAPTVFRTLPSAQAGDLMNRLFAPYHVVGYACGAAALIAAVLLARAGRAAQVRAGIIGLLLGLTLYAGLGISPEARALRAELRQAAPGTQDPARQARFTQLHRRAVALNGVIVAGVLVALIWAVVTPPTLSDQRAR